MVLGNVEPVGVTNDSGLGANSCSMPWRAVIVLPLASHNVFQGIHRPRRMSQHLQDIVSRASEAKWRG